MTMTMAESTQYWMALPDDIKSYFYGIASKSDGGHTAFEFFHTEIPDALKSDPDGIELLLDGGTVTVISGDEWPGPGPGQHSPDVVTVELPDRDMSRIDAGVNGGDYTPDNVVLENASVNRARGGVDMTDAELDTATESLASDAELISDRIGSNVVDVTTSVAETSTSMDGAVITAAESADGIIETVLDGVLPVTVGAKCAHGVWKSTEHMGTGRRVATTAAVGYTGFIFTAVALTNPVGAACAAAYGSYKLIDLGCKLWDRHVK